MAAGKYPWSDPVFTVGQQVECKNAGNTRFLREGGIYTVIDYEPEFYVWNVRGPQMLWPAYVTVEDEEGRMAHCHADRFTDA